MSLYLLIFFGTLGLSLFTAWRVKTKFRKYSEVRTVSGITGAEAARQILQMNAIDDVEVVAQQGMLSDHYDPLRKRLVLSEENYHGDSVAALGVAAHEVGHAIQHHQAYSPLQVRMLAVSATQIASQIVMWLPLVGIFTGIFAGSFGFTIMAIGWGVIMVFNLVTLPVEFDATRRAKEMLTTSGMIVHDEHKGVNEVLDAAAWTYVAAFITSFAYLLYYVLPFLSGSEK
ncbi:MAG: Zn-dependent membrane protease YugP [Verrucomicrobiales bacterium]|jgi:Zn-dependent membrane protease YugP